MTIPKPVRQRKVFVFAGVTVQRESLKGWLASYPAKQAKSAARARPILGKKSRQRWFSLWITTVTSAPTILSGMPKPASRRS
jgi:hypothetical protein